MTVVLKEGTCSFNIKRMIDVDKKTGKPLVTKSGKSYILGIFLVEDESGSEADMYHYFYPENNKWEISRLLKSIGHEKLFDYIDVPGFEWDEIEGCMGQCRVSVVGDEYRSFNIELDSSETKVKENTLYVSCSLESIKYRCMVGDDVVYGLIEKSELPPSASFPSPGNLDSFVSIKPYLVSITKSKGHAPFILKNKIDSFIRKNAGEMLKKPESKAKVKNENDEIPF